MIGPPFSILDYMGDLVRASRLPAAIEAADARARDASPSDVERAEAEALRLRRELAGLLLERVVAEPEIVARLGAGALDQLIAGLSGVAG